MLTDYSAQLNVKNDRTNAAATVQSAMSCQEMLQGWRQSIDLEHVWKLAVISDGIEQIDGIGAIDAAKQILEFRNLHGSYLKRAACLTLESWHETGHLPVDDLGLAVLTIE